MAPDFFDELSDAQSMCESHLTKRLVAPYCSANFELHESVMNHIMSFDERKNLVGRHYRATAGTALQQPVISAYDGLGPFCFSQVKLAARLTCWLGEKVLRRSRS